MTLHFWCFSNALSSVLWGNWSLALVFLGDRFNNFWFYLECGFWLPHFGFFSPWDCLIFPSLHFSVWFDFRLVVLALIRLGFMHADFDSFKEWCGLIMTYVVGCVILRYAFRFVVLFCFDDWFPLKCSPINRPLGRLSSLPNLLFSSLLSICFLKMSNPQFIASSSNSDRRPRICSEGYNLS